MSAKHEAMLYRMGVKRERKRNRFLRFLESYCGRHPECQMSFCCIPTAEELRNAGIKGKHLGSNAVVVSAADLRKIPYFLCNAEPTRKYIVVSWLNKDLFDVLV